MIGWGHTTNISIFDDSLEFVVHSNFAEIHGNVNSEFHKPSIKVVRSASKFFQLLENIDNKPTREEYSKRVHDVEACL